MCHGNARDLCQSLAQQFGDVFYTALSQFAIDQTNVDADVVFALGIGCVHAREGVLNFGILTHDGFDLFGFERGTFKGCAHRCLKVQGGF